MNAATAVSNADDLLDQARLGPCEIIPLQPVETFSIFCDGVLHTKVRSTIARARNGMIKLSNSRPEHSWSVE